MEAMASNRPFNERSGFLTVGAGLLAVFALYIFVNVNQLLGVITFLGVAIIVVKALFFGTLEVIDDAREQREEAARQQRIRSVLQQQPYGDPNPVTPESLRDRGLVQPLPELGRRQKPPQ